MPDQPTAAREDLVALVDRFLTDLGEFIDRLEREAGDAVLAEPATSPGGLSTDRATVTPDSARPQKVRRGPRAPTAPV